MGVSSAIQSQIIRGGSRIFGKGGRRGTISAILSRKGRRVTDFTYSDMQISVYFSFFLYVFVVV